jgi:hypothetical protein
MLGYDSSWPLSDLTFVSFWSGMRIIADIHQSL